MKACVIDGSREIASGLKTWNHEAVVKFALEHAADIGEIR